MAWFSGYFAKVHYFKYNDWFVNVQEVALRFGSILCHALWFVLNYICAKWLCIRDHLSQSFLEISLVGILCCENKSHWFFVVLAFAFLASCLSVKSLSLAKILRLLQAFSLIITRLSYLAWISFSSNLSGGIVRSRSSIPCFANSHLLFSAIRSRLYCAFVSFRSVALIQWLLHLAWSTLLMPFVPRPLSYVGSRKTSMQVL